jgi:hypothetical protein
VRFHQVKVVEPSPASMQQAVTIALFRVLNRYAGNLMPMPGVFPDYPAPVVRNTGIEREMVLISWGMPPPPKFGSPPRHRRPRNSSPHGGGWQTGLRD